MRIEVMYLNTVKITLLLTFQDLSISAGYTNVDSGLRSFCDRLLGSYQLTEYTR